MKTEVKYIIQIRSTLPHWQDLDGHPFDSISEAREYIEKTNSQAVAIGRSHKLINPYRIIVQTIVIAEESK